MSGFTKYNQARPPKRPKKIAMRLSSLSSVARSEVGSYLLIERPTGRVWSNTSYQQRMESRPPLRADLDGPTPCTYSANLPTPSVHGTKINPKSKYERDALPNLNTDLWTHNISLARTRPNPFSYVSHNVLGGRCPVVREAPSFSLTPRRSTKPGAEKRPGPHSYDSARAQECTLTQHPSFTMAIKRHKANSIPSPGPAHYHPLYSYTKHQSPSFSMQPARRQTRTATL